MLSIDNLTFRIEGRKLFDGASLNLPAGTKAGLVGRNGSGKTTLIRLILKELAPDDGEISVHRRARIGAVAQEAPATNDSVLEMVMMADTERGALLAEAEVATDGARIAEIHNRLAEITAHTAEARASAILKGLGFDKTRRNEPCAKLSGGWRMRVALAGMLFSQPDLLLLDEPTNYLDLEGALWLEKYLALYPYTVLLISHDRDLLNKAVSSIVHLDGGKLTLYRGAYDTFENTRRVQMELNNKAREKMVGQIAHMQAFVDRFRYKASKARQAQARLNAISKLKPPEAMFDENAIAFAFPQPKRSVAAPIVDFAQTSVGYDGEAVLSAIDMRIDPEDRIALIGINGNGKSTLAKLIAGDLTPMGGAIKRARKLEVAYFAQHQMDKLIPGETPLQHIEPLTPYDSEAKRRSRVARMGLTISRMDTPAGKLSGGERARLLLGLVTFAGPNLLILDEPTNHLDIDSRAALIAALNDYEGAVLIISHDRHLIEATVDRLWIADKGTISEYEGDLDDYQRDITGGERARKKSKGARPPAKPELTPASARKTERKAEAALRAEVAPLRKNIAQAEAMITRLDRDIGRVEKKLADPKLYEGNAADAIQLTVEKARLEDARDQAEAEWLEAGMALEEALKAQAG
jgi:ATP-binding cassette, subfamily F, member 3